MNKDWFIEKVWKDPVWSKVIAAGIILLINLLYNAIIDIGTQKFLEIIRDVLKYASWITSLIALYMYITVKILKNKLESLKSNQPITNPNELPIISEASTAFFQGRLAQAFPGQRGLKWYESKTAVQRLAILLQSPLMFRSRVNYYMGDPIWYFRGYGGLPIRKFRVLSKKKILLGIDELLISRIAVNIDDSYYKSYVYIEVEAEQPIGLYKHDAESIQNNIKGQRGYYNEEYGLAGKILLTREEYDDNAKVIKGKAVNIDNSELRTRYITSYNLILCAKQSPYNSYKFQKESAYYFNEILRGTLNTESLFTFLDSFTLEDSKWQ